MARLIENKMNRGHFVSPVTLATDYVAVQLYSEHAKPIRLHGINWGVRSTTPADYALIAFNDLRILRMGKIDANQNLTLANILALPFEEIYHSSCQGATNARYEDFRKGFELEPGNNYVILNGDASAGAVGGTISLFLTVRGALFKAAAEPQRRYQRETAMEPDLSQNGGQVNEC